MVVCQFFLRNQCRFGDNCKNEHERQPTSGFGHNSWTNPATPTSTTRAAAAGALTFSIDSMTKDLTSQKERPLYPFSVYGAAKYEPNIIEGIDESPEELRVKATVARVAGNISEYYQYESSQITQREQMIANMLSRVTDAYNRAVELHPQANAGLDVGSASFGGAAPALSAIVQPQSSFGQTTPFGDLSLIKPATGAFGGASTGAFGAFGAAKPGGSVFGVGGSASGTSAFAAAPPTSAFGAPVPAISAFGGAAPAAGFSAFANSGSAPSAFVAPRAPAPATSAFGAPAPATSAFSVPTSSVFGQASSVPIASTLTQPTVSTSMHMSSANSTGSTKSGLPDFTKPGGYRPGASKYDVLLPENYMSMLPALAKAAFEASSFEWGKVPEWIPPKEMR